MAPLLALLFACAEPPPGTCGSGGGVLTLGEGGGELRPLPPTGGTLDIILGSQGGIHVIVGFRAEGIDLEMTATYRLLDTNGELMTDPLVRELRPALFDRDGVHNPDLLVLSNNQAHLVDFAGVSATLRLEAQSGEALACDAREVVLLEPR